MIDLCLACNFSYFFIEKRKVLMFYELFISVKIFFILGWGFFKLADFQPF